MGDPVADICLQEGGGGHKSENLADIICENSHLGNVSLLLTDALSKWLEVFIVSSASSPQTIEKLRLCFSTHGIPDIIVSDN